MPREHPTGFEITPYSQDGPRRRTRSRFTGVKKKPTWTYAKSADRRARACFFQPAYREAKALSNRDNGYLGRLCDFPTAP